MSTGETTPGGYVVVNEYNDIVETTDRISDRDRNIVKTLVNDGLPDDHDVAVWIPDFINININNPEIDAVNSESRIHTGVVEDYSDDAWVFRQDIDEEPVFLPKDWVVVFEPATDSLKSDQVGLSEWSR